MAIILNVDFKNKKIIKREDVKKEEEAHIGFVTKDIAEIRKRGDTTEIVFSPFFTTKEGYEALIKWAEAAIGFWEGKIQDLGVDTNVEAK